MFIRIVLGLLFVAWMAASQAAMYTVPNPPDDVVGRAHWAFTSDGEDFHDVGRDYDIGYYELIEANPGVDPKLPGQGARIKIPASFILPNTPHQGIVINRAELRLYYYLPNSREVLTVPVGIGQAGWSTPLGKTDIQSKMKNPAWHVPKSVKEAKAKIGVHFPDVVPPGPDNPLGDFAMRLGWTSYLIHGTNDPLGIGRRSSSGCIRLYPEDIEHLFGQVAVGAPVRVVEQPIKVGWLHNKLYLEVHVPSDGKLPENNLTPMIKRIMDVIGSKHVKVSWDEANTIAEQQLGIPEVIGERVA